MMSTMNLVCDFLWQTPTSTGIGAPTYIIAVHLLWVALPQSVPARKNHRNRIALYRHGCITISMFGCSVNHGLRGQPAFSSIFAAANHNIYIGWQISRMLCRPTASPNYLKAKLSPKLWTPWPDHYHVLIRKSSPVG